MPLLSSGFVIAGAYADKIRRTLFAQMRDYTKSDKSWNQKIAYAVAQLNRFLYTILVEELKIDKGDVVRVRIEYEIDEASKEIKWKWDTLQIEAFRRIPQDQVDAVVKKLIHKSEEFIYDIRYLGKTFDGDDVYVITIGDERVGVAITTDIDSRKFLKLLVVSIPTPMKVEKTFADIKEVLGMLDKYGKEIDQKTADALISKVLESVIQQPSSQQHEQSSA